jgi:hypothetical protein
LNTYQQLSISPEEIASRLHDLADADLCEHCEIPVTCAMTDIARLLSQVRTLNDALAQARMRAANLEAAMRAALSAQVDGETDPLAYLRFELADVGGGDAYGP